MGFNREHNIILPALVAAYAAGVLTSDNTNVSDGDTVTIGTKVYTFKTTLTASTTDGEVLIGSDADDSLLNLKKAINGESGGGTKYGSLTPVNTQVVAGAVTAHAITCTAIASGATANLIATTETSSHLSWAAITLTGGNGGATSDVTLKGAAAFATEPIDVGAYAELLAFLNSKTHAGTSPTLDIKFQFSPDQKNWVDSGDSFTQVAETDSLTFKRLTANFGKYMRAVITLGGTLPAYKFDLMIAAKA